MVAAKLQQADPVGGRGGRSRSGSGGHENEPARGGRRRTRGGGGRFLAQRRADAEAGSRFPTLAQQRAVTKTAEAGGRYQAQRRAVTKTEAEAADSRSETGRRQARRRPILAQRRAASKTEETSDGQETGYVEATTAREIGDRRQHELRVRKKTYSSDTMLGIATCIPEGPKAIIYSICTCVKYAGNTLTIRETTIYKYSSNTLYHYSQ
jgi:hypothetical protein